MKNKKNITAQALLEIAILFSIFMFLLSSLVRMGLTFSERQKLNMNTYRNALKAVSSDVKNISYSSQVFNDVPMLNAESSTGETDLSELTAGASVTRSYYADSGIVLGREGAARQHYIVNNKKVLGVDGKSGFTIQGTKKEVPVPIVKCSNDQNKDCYLIVKKELDLYDLIGPNGNKGYDGIGWTWIAYEIPKKTGSTTNKIEGVSHNLSYLYITGKSYYIDGLVNCSKAGNCNTNNAKVHLTACAMANNTACAPYAKDKYDKDYKGLCPMYNCTGLSRSSDICQKRIEVYNQCKAKRSDLEGKLQRRDFGNFDSQQTSWLLAKPILYLKAMMGGCNSTQPTYEQVAPFFSVSYFGYYKVSMSYCIFLGRELDYQCYNGKIKVDNCFNTIQNNDRETESHYPNAVLQTNSHCGGYVLNGDGADVSPVTKTEGRIQPVFYNLGPITPKELATKIENWGSTVSSLQTAGNNPQARGQTWETFYSSKKENTPLLMRGESIFIGWNSYLKQPAFCNGDMACVARFQSGDGTAIVMNFHPSLYDDVDAQIGTMNPWLTIDTGDGYKLLYAAIDKVSLMSTHWGDIDVNPGDAAARDGLTRHEMKSTVNENKFETSFVDGTYTESISQNSEDEINRTVYLNPNRIKIGDSSDSTKEIKIKTKRTINRQNTKTEDYEE